MPYEDDNPDLMGEISRRIGPPPESPGAFAFPSTREEYRSKRALWESMAGPAGQKLLQERIDPLSVGQVSSLVGNELAERTATPQQFTQGPATPNLPPDIIDMRSRFGGRTGFSEEMMGGGVLKRHPLDPGIPYSAEQAQRLNQFSQVEPGAQPGKQELDPLSPANPLQRQLLGSEIHRRSLQNRQYMDPAYQASQYADSVSPDRGSPEWLDAYHSALSYKMGQSSRPMAEPEEGGMRAGLIEAQTKQARQKPGQIDRSLGIKERVAATGEKRADTYQQDVDNRNERGMRSLDLKQEGLDLKKSHEAAWQAHLANLQQRGATSADVARDRLEFDKVWKRQILRGYLSKKGVMSDDEEMKNMAEMLSFATGEPAYANPGGWFSSGSVSRTPEEGGLRVEPPSAEQEFKRVQPVPKQEKSSKPDVGAEHATRLFKEKGAKPGTKARDKATGKMYVWDGKEAKESNE